MYQIFGRFLYSYRFADKSLDFMLFRFVPVVSISYVEITSARQIGFEDAIFSGLWFANRVFGKIVIIRKKGGMFKSICITPDDADTFVSMIETRIRESIG
jgi:hypothetical protein